MTREKGRAELSRQIHCSFCGKSRREAETLIAAPGDVSDAVICDECVWICRNLLETHKAGLARRVLAAYGEVVCPATGKLAERADCARAAGPVPIHNPAAVRLWRQCRSCSYRKENLNHE